MSMWIRSSHCDTSACVEVRRPSPVTFRKSSASGLGECVEVGICDCANVLIRDSKDPDGPVLMFTPAEWTAFILGAKAGEFD